MLLKVILERQTLDTANPGQINTDIAKPTHDDHKTYLNIRENKVLFCLGFIMPNMYHV